MELLELQEDGSQLRMYISAAMLNDVSACFHPKELFDTVTKNVGLVPPTSMLGNQDKELINHIMLDGEKSVPQGIVYDAFKIMSEKVNTDAMEIFKQALANITPVVEVKARRVGGANYQVPVEIRPERRQTLAIRWLVINTRKRSEREMSKKLAAELMDAYNNTGGSVKKKEDTHRMAEANKAFAHFRF